ncbi:hypothetical protein CHS0354_026791 [Potamilus streckersoni]|uniref:MutL C-terminal dimerisation domain-containing protein n=1 Tax=Potamilus streckersoni TaxID=2493646 RepID=A0AAE0T533_9BIVA|nr:hypothetical protein CHS0354_026791 [Potamilus streckersoni]
MPVYSQSGKRSVSITEKENFEDEMPSDIEIVGTGLGKSADVPYLPEDNPFSALSWKTPQAVSRSDENAERGRIQSIGEFVHERIRYEEIRTAYYSGDPARKQPLLSPLVITLSPRDSILLEKDLVHWQKIGFDIEPFGRHTYKISALPVLFTGEKVDAEEMIKEIIDELAVFGKSGKNEVYLNRIFEKMACRSSIRGEKHMSVAEMDALLEKLLTMDINLYCPHGRPVISKITNTNWKNGLSGLYESTPG